MAQGLECWNAQGVQVVELGDYNIRYMGAVSLNVSAGSTTAWTVPFANMRPNGWLAILRTTQWWNNYYCIPGTDGFTVQYLPTRGTYSGTLVFDVYKYEN